MYIFSIQQTMDIALYSIIYQTPMLYSRRCTHKYVCNGKDWLVCLIHAHVLAQQIGDSYCIIYSTLRLSILHKFDCMPSSGCQLGWQVVGPSSAPELASCGNLSCVTSPPLLVLGTQHCLKRDQLPAKYKRGGLCNCARCCNFVRMERYYTSATCHSRWMSIACILMAYTVLQSTGEVIKMIQGHAY